MPLANRTVLTRREREAKTESFTLAAMKLPVEAIAWARRTFEIPDLNDRYQAIKVSGVRITGDSYLIVDNLFAPLLEDKGIRGKHAHGGTPDFWFDLPEIYTQGTILIRNPEEYGFRLTVLLADFPYALIYQSDQRVYHNLWEMLSKAADLALLPKEVLQSVVDEGPMTVITASVGSTEPKGSFDNCTAIRLAFKDKNGFVMVSDPYEPGPKSDFDVWGRHRQGIKNSIGRSAGVFFID